MAAPYKKENCLRYIVPFTYDDSEGLEAINHRIRTITIEGRKETLPLWEEANLIRKGNDLYDFVKNSFQDAERSEQAIGSTWEISRQCRKSYFPKLYLTHHSSVLPLTIQNLGLYLFRTGVGFIWYELDLPVQSAENFVEFASILKEFSFLPKGTFLEEETVEELDTGCSLRHCTAKEQANPPESYLSIQGRPELALPKTSVQAPERFSADARFIERNGTIVGRQTSRRKSEYFFARFVLKALSFLSIKSFFTSRTKKDVQENLTIPNKAILFSSVLLGNVQTTEILPYLYWLGKGYTPSFHYPDSFIRNYESLTCIPFQNTHWYTSLEGCSQIVTASADEKTNLFFESAFKERLLSYFHLYVMALHQHYCLLKLSIDISLLPSTKEGYNQSSARKLLKQYKEDLNFLLMNFMYLQVSPISHQNDFSDYLHKNLGIHEMYQLLKEKTSLMNEMVAEWQNDKTSRRLSIFTIIGSIFVFIQTLNNIVGLYDMNFLSINSYLPEADFTFFALLSAVAIGGFFWFLSILKK